jgi:glutamyl-tRNA synthetase
VLAFRDMGILPEAMLNYLARLGWSHGDQEIFSREDLIQHFDLTHVGAADAVFDLEKFKWVNHQWIKRLPAARLAADLVPFLERAGLPAPRDLDWLARVVDTLKERARTLVEMAEQAAFYLRPPDAYDPQSTAKFWKDQAAERYAILIKRLEAQPAMDPQALEELYRFLAADLELKLVDLAQLTRIAVTGKTASPSIFEVVSILGKAETLARLRAAAAAVEARR